MEENLNNPGSQTQRYLNQSLDDIPIFRARYSSAITEEQRMDLLLDELNLVKKEVEVKKIETECKSNWFRILNGLFSLLILMFSAVIIGIQAASECINIPVIVFSSLIFIIEGAHKLFKWGPQGVLYKNGSVQLRKILGQIREHMYMSHRYTSEQLLSLIGQLRSQYDDIDIGLYKTSINGAVKYNTGLDIEEGGGGIQNPPNFPRLNNNELQESTPHLHIHIDNSTPGTPVSNQSPSEGNSAAKVPPLPIKSVVSNRRLVHVRSNSMPTIEVDIDDSDGPISINKH